VVTASDVDVRDPAVFERLVAEALDGIPEEFARHLENVAVVIEEEPSAALLERMGLDPRRHTLLGLYQGVPLSQRSHDFAGAPPDHITIFRRPIVCQCPTAAQLRRQVQQTVIHEIAHFFGIDEQRIRALGY
jgi:predicted Zn-dependent protease with MMP-like domain